MSKHTIPTELNIAPRGKSWLNGQLIDGVHGYPTRQSMENAERAAFEKWARFFGTWDVERDDEPNFSTTGYTDITVNVSWLAWQARAALAATPAGSAVQCTCPSGDGSLQWPCPAHPPTASTLAAPAGVAEPTPITFMTEDRAREWAWDKVREEVGTQSWTAGESFNFHGFYLWGWNYRAQYELQRTATRAAVIQEILSAAPAAAAPARDGKLPGRLQRALNELRIDCKTDAVSSLEFEVRSAFEGMRTSLATVKSLYHAAQKRLDSVDAVQPDPFADAAEAAPVVLPEPDFWVRPGATIHPDRGWQCWSNDGTATGAFHAETVRALLATATGLPAQAVAALHPDDAAVDGLAALMKAKLAKQRDKGYGGWDTDCTRQRLSELLRGHVDKGDPVDVANFCAFLTARREGISPLPKAEGWVAANEGIGEAMQRACIDLPVGCEVVISLEKDAGTVHWFDQDGNQHDIHEDGDFADTINAATTAAIAATKGQ